MLSFFFAWVTSGLQKNITFKIIISTHFSDIFYQLI
jgi:hypothetical protein